MVPTIRVIKAQLFPDMIASDGIMRLILATSMLQIRIISLKNHLQMLKTIAEIRMIIPEGLGV